MLEITKELLAAILKEYNPHSHHLYGDMAEFLAKRIAEITDIHQKVNMLQQTQTELKKKHDQEIKVIQNKIELKQDHCQHELVKHFIGQESSDNYNQCSICGKYLT